jgi:hypothetical protein
MHGVRLSCTWRTRQWRRRRAVCGLGRRGISRAYCRSHMATVYIMPYGWFCRCNPFGYFIHIRFHSPHDLGISRGQLISLSSRISKLASFLASSPCVAAGDGTIAGYRAALIMPQYQPGYLYPSKKCPGRSSKIKPVSQPQLQGPLLSPFPENNVGLHMPLRTFAPTSFSQTEKSSDRKPSMTIVHKAALRGSGPVQQPLDKTAQGKQNSIRNNNTASPPCCLVEVWLVGRRRAPPTR